MKRRLILARALMHRPRLLILDEPTAGVDVELRLELWHYVQRINAEGTTILLTTHYLEEAEQLCDKIAFINDGQIVAQGTQRRARRALRRDRAGGRLPGAGRAQGALARERLGDRVMTAAQIRFVALLRREVNRFLKIKRQTLGAPLLETFLYISVFGAALGSRIDKLHGVDYVVFIVPGPDHDGLGDERVLQQLVVDPAAEVPALDRRPAVLAGVAAASCCWRSPSAASCAA